MKLLQLPLVVEWSKRSPSAPYHFRSHLSLCWSSKSSPNTSMDIIIVLSTFATHQEPPRNIGFVFIQSDWNNQLYRRVGGTLLPSVDEDTVQVMENKSMFGCVITRVSAEGGCYNVVEFGGDIQKACKVVIFLPVMHHMSMQTHGPTVVVSWSSDPELASVFAVYWEV